MNIYYMASITSGEMANCDKLCTNLACTICTEKYRTSVRYFSLADLTVSKRPGTSNRIEIHFAVFNHLYLCFSSMKLVKTL